VSTRRAGTTFAMISLGFGEMVTALTLIFVAFFNGEEGIQADRWLGPEPLGITFGPQIQVYYLIVGWCLICMVAMYLITKTPLGRMSNAVRDNPERAQFVGYNTQRVRWAAFSLSAFFAGVAGTLHALNYEHVGFETVSIAQSGLVLFMVYIGGMGHYLGPILGAILITLLNGILSDFTEAWQLYLGILFCAIVLFAPGGLAGLIMMHEPIWRVDVALARRLVVPYVLAAASTVVVVIGGIGIVEMLYFLSDLTGDETEMVLFGIPVDAGGMVPWIACAAVIAVGVFLCRLTYPLAAHNWDAAITEARERLVG
jgi:branched-chain amino acid transport system permease protein